MDRKVVPITGARPFSNRREPQLETLPVQPVRFPQATKPPAIGSVIGHAPLTPGQLIREGTASQQVGRKLLRFGVWEPITVDRPTILFPLMTNLQTEGPVIRYNYGGIPDVEADSQVSERCGSCYLSNPGEWWILNKVAPGQSGFTFEALTIDASMPEVAARFMRQAGVNRVDQDNFVIDDATVAVLVASPNRFRRAITLQNVADINGSDANLRVCVIGLDTYLIVGGVWTGQGLLLEPGGAMTLEERALSNDGIYVCLEAAGSTALEVVDYFDDVP